MQDSLCNWRHEAPYSLHILGFFGLCLDSFCVNGLHHTQHISAFGTILCLVPKTLALKTLLYRGRYSKFLDLENYACFLAYKSLKVSALACFGLSHLILIKGRSLCVLLDFIRSASAWVILLKSSNYLKSFTVMFIDIPLKTKILLFEASAE